MHHRNLEIEMNPLIPNMLAYWKKELNIAPKLFLLQGPQPQCEMITCNNNFQSALNEGWDEDEEPAAETEKLDSWLSDCLQSLQLLTLA